MKKVVLLSSILMMAGAMNAWADACAAGTEGTYGAITISTISVNGSAKCTAMFDASGTDDFEVPQDFAVDKVVFSRAFNAQQYQTIVLPISLENGGYVNGGGFFTMSGVIHDSEASPWRINCPSIKVGDLVSNTPYIMQAYGKDSITITADSNAGITIHATTSDGASVNAFDEDWEFRGTYTYKEWGENDPAIGRVYGFAATDKDNVKAGQFVRGKAGAFIKPMRAYLYYTKKASSTPDAKGMLAKTTANVEDLPQTIEVVFKDADGNPLSIGRLNPTTGVVTPVEGWFDMKGRKLNQKPTLPGTYFNNGEKVIIK